MEEESTRAYRITEKSPKGLLPGAERDVYGAYGRWLQRGAVEYGRVPEKLVQRLFCRICAREDFGSIAHGRLRQDRLLQREGIGCERNPEIISHVCSDREQRRFIFEGNFHRNPVPGKVSGREAEMNRSGNTGFTRLL